MPIDDAERAEIRRYVRERDDVLRSLDTENHVPAEAWRGRAEPGEARHG